MGIFDFFKRKISTSTDVVVKNDEKEKNEDKSNIDIGIGITRDASISNSISEANLKYSRPDYNPQTRKAFYDDGSAHKIAIENAFSSGDVVKDPYSGAELVQKQRDAKIQFGQNWQKHAAEADHIDPLSQIANRTKNNPFLTTEDIKEIGNSQDNFQVLSRKLNQGSKEVGKGGSTQLEWADDSERMKGLGEYIENGESVDSVSNRIKEIGISAEKRNDERALQRSITNAVDTAHSAGTDAAKNSGTTALTMSGIMNVVSVIKGEKTGEEAFVDTVKDTGKAAATGYVMGAGLTTTSQILSKSSSEFIQGLAKSNVPGKVITAVIVTGDTLKKWGDGDITTQECLLQLGDKGLNMATMGYSMAVGQALIPIPVVGGAVGALVGSVLTSNLYSNLTAQLKTKQLEYQERERIIAECKAAAEQYRKFNEELQAHIDAYFNDYRSCLDEAMSSIKLSYAQGDVDGVIAGANQITRKLGGTVQYDTFEEFKEFINDDTTPFIL